MKLLFFGVFLAGSLSLSAQGVSNPSGNVCTGVVTRFHYNGSCSGSIMWRIEPDGGSGAIIVSSTNSYADIRWTTAMGSTYVAAICTSNSSQNGTTTPFQVYAPSTPSVSISGPATICIGSVATYHATSTNGGTPTYNWKVNGVSKQTGANSQFNYNLLQLNDDVTVQMTSNKPCATQTSVTSNSITIATATQPLNVQVQITQDGSLCSTDVTQNVTFHATSNQGGGSPTFKWYRSSAGEDEPTLDNDLLPANGSAYKPHYQLSNGERVWCVMTSALSGCISNNPAKSNEITISISQGQTPTMEIIPSKSSFCSGDEVMFSVSSTHALSNYSWHLNTGTPDGNFTSNTNSITGPFSTGSSVTVTASASGYCMTTSAVQASSASLALNVYPLPDATINPSGTRAIASTESLVVTTGSQPGHSYQWKRNGTLIPAPEGTVNPLSVNTSGTYTVTIKSINNCTSTTATPLVLTKNIAPVANAGVDITLSWPVNFVTLNGSSSDGDGSIISNSWNQVSGPSNAVLTNENTLSATVTGMQLGTYVFKLTATDNFPESRTDETTVIIAPPPNNYNYIREISVLQKGKIQESQIQTLPIGEKSVATTYFDGIGRPMQNVITQGSPGNLDIVQPIVYDAFGREEKRYLPFTSQTNGWYKPNTEIINSATDDYTSIAGNFYNNPIGEIADDNNKPFSRTIFEPSPLGHVLKQGAPGEAWQPKPDPADFSDKTIKKQYLTNAPSEVLRWTYIPSTHLVSAKNVNTMVYYAPNELYVTKTYDEQNKLTVEYTDKEGRIVLKRVQATATPGSLTDANKDTNYASTYYIYDDFGSLVTVIQPEGVSKLTSQYPTSASAPLPETFLTRWAFRYKYDSRKRMTEKSVPGAMGPVFRVYDGRDRLVLTQDANQRSVGTKYWTFIKYDELNRSILTGIKDTTADMTQAAMQLHVDAHYQKSWAKWSESYIGNVATNIHGYSNKSYPITTSNSVANPLDFLTVTYYDNYTFRDNWVGSYSYMDETLTETSANTLYQQPDNEFLNVKGLVTGTMVKVLDEGVRGGYLWLSSVSYYDDKYRTIQSVTENHTGSLDRSTILYDFTGKILSTKTTHSVMWKDQVGVDTSPNSLTKRYPSNSWGNAGAASMAKLPAGQDGWMEVVISETNTLRMIGLSDVNIDAGYTTIDYAFYPNGTSLNIRENGVDKGQIPGGVSIGTVLRIERSGTVVRYYKNGSLVYTSGTPSSTSLMVDATLYSNNSSVTGIRMSFASPERVIARRFEYDHAGRLVKTWHKVNSSPEILLSKNEYNELGQLVDKKLHSNNGNATDAKQSVDYRYNIRGWLTSINNASVTPDVQSNEARDLFGMELGYNETLGLSGTTDLQYNGNISAIKWNAMPGTASVEAPQKGYAFSYDPMNRLQKAEYKEKAAAWNSSAAFNEDNLQYDLNGNIQKLNRKQNGEQIDQLDYAYGTGTVQSNRLLSVTDAASDEKGFRELNSPGDDYVYDDNGNLLWDRNRGGAEFLSNGSFDNGSSGWSITGASQRFIFGSGQLEVSSNTSTAEIYVSSGIIPAKPYVVVVDLERTSATGTIVMKVGNAPVTISSSGVLTFTVKASGADSFRLTFDAAWTGIVRSVSVKGIAVISYNHLNLPTLVTFPSDKQLSYTYDATGRKLCQQVEKSGVVLKKTDYSGEFFYENDTLKFINHEEGRVVMTGAGPEYQYHLKDHLGNVRVTFTTNDEIDTLTATGELARREYDLNTFGSYSPTEDDLFDHTDVGTTYKFAQLLHGGHNSQVAMTKSLSVMPGDTIKVEVYAKYREIPNPGAGLTGFAAALTSAFGLNTPIPGDPGVAYNTLNDYGTLIAGGFDHSEDETAPKAYLNILLFDRNHQFVDAAYRQIDIDNKQIDLVIKADHDTLQISKLVTTPGYAYIFVSNENPIQVDVFFDDLKLLHVKSPVVQMDDYYPFGLAFNSYSRENSPQQNYLYNGKELQDELNLGWYDYQTRLYDPTIGRWMVVDPAADLMRRHSPYNYAFDNPLRFIDPDGMVPEETDPEKKKEKEKPKQEDLNIFEDGLLGIILGIDKLGEVINQGQGDESDDLDDNLVEGTNALADFIMTAFGAYMAPVEAGGQGKATDKVDDAANQADNFVDDAVKISISKSRHPESAAHAEQAMKAGVSNKGTIDRSGRNARRQQTLKDIPTQAGKDRDEFPPAVINNGGNGSSVQHITPSDNRGSGGSIGQQIKKLRNGTRVIIIVKD